MDRVQALLDDNDYKEFIRKNDTKEAGRKFCRHGFQHLIDVARITYILMLENGGIDSFVKETGVEREKAKEVVYAASLLHDIGRWNQYETGEDHAVVSAVLAKPILERAGFDAIESHLIMNAIKEHRRMKENMSMLGGYLYKGDKLSRLCFQCNAREECYKWGSSKCIMKLSY